MKHTLSLAAVLLITLVASAYAGPTADAVMQRSFALPQAKTMQATAYMLLVDPNGGQSLRTFAMYTRKQADGTDSYIEFLSPPDVKGTKFLSLASAAGGEVQRLWLPELRRVRRIATAGKGEKFVGSDLSYYDMSEHHFADSRYEIKGEESVETVVDGRKQSIACWVIDATPLDSEVPYARTRLWIGKEDSFAYRSKMWGRRDEVLKTIYILEVTKRDGIILPLRTGVVAADGHKTLLQLNDLSLDRPIDPALFTVANLER